MAIDKAHEERGRARLSFILKDHDEEREFLESLKMEVAYRSGSVDFNYWTQRGLLTLRWHGLWFFDAWYNDKHIRGSDHDSWRVLEAIRLAMNEGAKCCPHCGGGLE